MNHQPESYQSYGAGGPLSNPNAYVGRGVMLFLLLGGTVVRGRIYSATGDMLEIADAEIHTSAGQITVERIECARKHIQGIGRAVPAE